MEVQNLIQNIIDQIKEAQLKLGYVSETIRLYFPLESLNGILCTEYTEGEELLTVLRNNEELNHSALGYMRFSLHAGRVEVRISPEGARYVKEQVPDPVFLQEWIRMFSVNHHLTIEEICACFARFNEDYICEQMEEGSDFDYVLHFCKEIPDAYYYCVKMEMGHTIYHRFIRADYERLME